jgi:hypothetical protein
MSGTPAAGRPGGRVLVAHQPAYLPWPGFFSRLLDVDQLLLLDHVQFSPGGWQQRNFLLAGAGRQVVTVPVAHLFGQPISQARISGDRWRDRHWKTITAAYRRAPYFRRWSEPLGEIYAQPWESLAGLNTALIRLLLDALELNVKLVASSEIRPAGRSTGMLASLCELTGSRVLRVGAGAAGPGGYLDRALLAEAGIAVEVASYDYRPYPQQFPGFTGGLSALDLVLNCGPASRQILTTSGTIRPLAPEEVTA